MKARALAQPLRSAFQPSSNLPFFCHFQYPLSCLVGKEAQPVHPKTALVHCGVAEINVYYNFVSTRKNEMVATIPGILRLLSSKQLPRKIEFFASMGWPQKTVFALLQWRVFFPRRRSDFERTWPTSLTQKLRWHFFCSLGTCFFNK
jgi:hypothetical protein